MLVINICDFPTRTVRIIWSKTLMWSHHWNKVAKCFDHSQWQLSSVATWMRSWCPHRSHSRDQRWSHGGGTSLISSLSAILTSDWPSDNITEVPLPTVPLSISNGGSVKTLWPPNRLPWPWLKHSAIVVLTMDHVPTTREFYIRWHQSCKPTFINVTLYFVWNDWNIAETYFICQQPSKFPTV